MDNLLAPIKKAVMDGLAPTPDDLLVVDYYMSIVVSNFLDPESDPLWGWLIGPPGSMKTELLRSLKDHDCAYFVSSLTPQSLISGFEREDGRDPSLLASIDKKILTIKEFTSVIGLPDSQTRQIFGDLRSIYDGFHNKQFGSVGTRGYTTRFAMLAAVTPHIDKYTMVHNDLGERFLAFRLSRFGAHDWDTRQRLARHVWNAADTKPIWRKVIKDATHAALSVLAKTEMILPTSTEPQIEEMLNISNALTIVRTLTPKDDHPASPELPGRTVQQIKWLTGGHAIVCGRTALDDSDLALARRVSFDTIPAAISRVLLHTYIWQREVPEGSFLALDSLSKATSVPVAWLNHLSRQYKHIDVFDRHQNNIRFCPEFFKHLAESGIIEAGMPSQKEKPHED